MPPMQIDRSALVGGAYHEVDPRVCYVLVNYSQENIDAAWGNFCEEIGWCEPKKESWWRRLWTKRP